MKLINITFFLCICTLALSAANTDTLRIVFWNTENLFDTIDNPSTNDNDFLPQAPRHWSFWRYRRKLINISKGLIASGEGRIPAIIGLCEVENDSVIADLSKYTFLRNLHYRYLITHSPDLRGINNVLLYRHKEFRLIAHNEYTVTLDSTFRPTRNILYACGEFISGDTLDIFVCHFPSRLGGEKASQKARITANIRLKSLCDSIFRIRHTPNILVMGDMNDYPGDTPLKEYLLCDGYLTDLMQNLKKGIECGSHKFNGHWNYLDHFIASQNMTDKNGQMNLINAKEFRAEFLLTEDTRYFGKRCLRTYYGFRNEKGFSDHLPIVCDIVIKY